MTPRSDAAPTVPDEFFGDVTFCVIGMIDDLQKRGLSRNDAWAVLAEIERRHHLYKENPDRVPPYRGEGG